MSKINNGGSAFPLPLGTANCSEPEQSGGMSLRDYFAAKAIQGLIAQSCGTALESDHILGAQYAYRIADAMLAARKTDPQQ